MTDSSTEPEHYTPPETPGPYEQAVVSLILNRDEGGRKLTRDADGGDGGWTYAGVTFKTWYLTMKYSYYSYADMKELLNNSDKKKSIDGCVDFIYYRQYYIPAWNSIDSLDHPGGKPLEDFEFSCVINCGLEGFREVLEAAFEEVDRRVALGTHAGPEDYKDIFCECWREHYDKIIAHNPAKKQFLKTWNNRVDYYDPRPETKSL